MKLETQPKTLSLYSLTYDNETFGINPNKLSRNYVGNTLSEGKLTTKIKNDFLYLYSEEGCNLTYSEVSFIMGLTVKCLQKIANTVGYTKSTTARAKSQFSSQLRIYGKTKISDLKTPTYKFKRNKIKSMDTVIRYEDFIYMRGQCFMTLQEIADVLNISLTTASHIEKLMIGDVCNAAKQYIKNKRSIKQKQTWKNKRETKLKEQSQPKKLKKYTKKQKQTYNTNNDIKVTISYTNKIYNRLKAFLFG